MRSRWRFWVELFDGREAGTSLALFRVALGLVILYSLLSIAGAGLVEALWTSVEHGGMRRVGGNWLVQWFGGPTPSVVWAFWSIALVANLAFVAGLGGPVMGRLGTFILLQVYNGLATINPLASGSYDALISNALWLMVFADATATLSVHARRTTGRWTTDQQVCAWPRYVLIVQILVMYTMTGLQKSAHIWTPSGGYEALYWVMQDLGWTRYDLGEIAAWTTPLLRVGTAITWHWEQFSILLLLWFYFRCTAERPGRLRHWVLRRDWRLGWAIVGILLHVNILIVMNVGPFSWVSMGYYVLMWTPEEWAGLAERMRERLQQRVGG